MMRRKRELGAGLGQKGAAWGWGWSAAIGLVVLFVAMGRARAQCERQKLVPADAGQDFVGASVAIDGEVAVIGTWKAAGAAYVYRLVNGAWQEEQKLASPDYFGSMFGFKTAVSGDRVLVGAQEDDSAAHRAGAAFVFRFDGTGWAQEQKLTASDGDERDFLGSDISIQGDIAVVGAYGDEVHGPDSGSAYVFRFDGTRWVQEQKIVPSDLAPSDYFGRTVAAGDGLIAVSAWGADELGPSSGSVYVYRFDGAAWALEVELHAADTSGGDEFGRSLALSDDRLLVGAHGDDEVDQDGAGAAYVFRFDGTAWYEEQKLTASDRRSRANFGHAVDIAGEFAVVGARNDRSGGQTTGSAYVFRFDGSRWHEEKKLLASDREDGDEFGVSVGVAGDTALVGAWMDDSDQVLFQGSAYVFDTRGVRLRIVPTSPSPGDLVSFATGKGRFLDPAGLSIVAVDGAHFAFWMGFGTFDINGDWIVSTFVPNHEALVGHTFTFRSFFIDPCTRTPRQTSPIDLTVGPPGS